MKRMIGLLAATAGLLLGVPAGDHSPAPAGAKAAAPFASERVTIRTVGQGPDVILVPGLTSNPRIYEAMIAALPGYRYHLVQVRGFSGTSAGANATGDVSSEVANELARYIREKKLARPALIGHSMGGTIGLTLASRHPQALGRLMVVDMAPFTGAFFGAKDAAEARTIVGRMQTQMAADPAASRAMMTQMISAMVNNEAARPAVLEDARTSDPAVVARTFADIQTTDLREALKAITVPVTVLYVKPAQAQQMPDEAFDGMYRSQYANLAGVKLVRIPIAAHFIMLDAPARFNAEVKTFLAPKGRP